jgi:drug/metabolite transporter (DMT)-like permease
MLIFSTIGIIRRYIPLSSDFISFIRGMLGSICVILFILLTKKKLDKDGIKNNLILLIVSGVCIGLNWVFLFESYNYTSVATGTLCNYMCPIFVIIFSPIILKEKLNIINVICVIVSFIGMVFVSGILETGFNDKNTLIGVCLGLLSAVLYAAVIFLNKKMREVDSYSKTLIQLLSIAVVMFFYTLFNSGFSSIKLDFKIIILLIVIGVIYTGIVYVLYFSGIKDMSAQSIAILSIIDPMLAVILSSIILSEPLSIFTIIGAVLILSSTVISEVCDHKKISK